MIGAQNALVCYDPHTLLQRWAVPFDSPLVAAFPGGSATNMLPGAHSIQHSLSNWIQIVVRTAADNTLILHDCACPSAQPVKGTVSVMLLKS